MLVCVFLCTVAHETAGAACTRCSLRPLIKRVRKFLANLGRIVPRDREVVSCWLFENVKWEVRGCYAAAAVTTCARSASRFDCER